MTMIPIYEEITKRLSLPENKGKIYGSENNNFNEVHHLVHAFSCTAIASDVTDIYNKEGGDIEKFTKRFFLPFEKIFISTIDSFSGDRYGYFCENNGDNITINLISEHKNYLVWFEEYICIPIIKHNTIKNCFMTEKESIKIFKPSTKILYGKDYASFWRFTALFFCHLAFINSPGVIDATAKPPSLSAQRYFRSHGMFPFKAVTEIKIKPGVAYTPGKGKSPLRRSGGVCRHEVRSHERRLHDGRITIVKSHPRGDEKYGVKKSRYNVVPPRGGGASVGV